MSIQLVTYANQTVTPTNDAIIYEKAINNNGIFYGCNVTVSSNNVNITGGYGIICGREFVVQSESIAVTLAPSGTLLGRLYVRLDLADADNPIQLLTATGNSLPALEQDANVNYTNGVWEMELATFDVGVSALSNVVKTFETINGNAPLTNDGSLVLSGNITLENHSSAIAWYDAHTDTTSVSSGTSFASISGSAITLPPGRYLLLGSARFAGNATGYRGICIFKGSSNMGRSQSSHPAIPSASFNTTLNCSCFDVITSSTTYYLGVFQNSGGALNVTWDFYAVRIR